MTSSMFEEIIGTHDLRLDSKPAGGFRHLVLRDSDDGDTIVINEDDIEPLRDKLSQILQEIKDASTTATPDRAEAYSDDHECFDPDNAVT